MRRVVVCWAVAMALAALVRPQLVSAGLINVTMNADVNTGIFEIFAQITDTSTTGLGGDIITGLAGYALDVTASGGVSITSITNQSPVGSGVTGFTVGRSVAPIAGGFRVGALQNTSGGPGPLVLQGVGITAGSDAFGATWSVPVLLVSGTFTAPTDGTLTATPIGAAPNTMNVMHGPGGVWTSAFSVTTVPAVTAVANIAAIPEPSTFGVLALAFSLAGAYRFRRRSGTKAAA